MRRNLDIVKYLVEVEADININNTTIIYAAKG